LEGGAVGEEEEGALEGNTVGTSDVGVSVVGDPVVGLEEMGENVVGWLVVVGELLPQSRVWSTNSRNVQKTFGGDFWRGLSFSEATGVPHTSVKVYNVEPIEVEPSVAAREPEVG
jgi:hypothetical protein